MKRASAKTESSSLQLLPLPVDIDLVRFEKNLLQIGFFGANDARDKGRTTRRIEQTVMRNGHKVRVAAEFRASDQLGLPSTTDRDKFIALLKIANEERTRTGGQVTNPIRFSGYRMIQELGLSRNGEIYEEILRWGKRMTDTTITSEQVVYFAAKKLYSDEVLHVFRSFRRTGSSKLSGADRQEQYEVVLEDWILENLNQRYVVPEDFNAYKQLTRPTAKGIFGNLHLWFHASAGRPIEKDYVELCNLLNVQAYPHLSKIKSTMGLALNELLAIRYISRWDVQPMSSKDGYKIVLTPGEALLDILRNQRRELTGETSAAVQTPGRVPEPDPAQTAALSAERDSARDMLLRHGVLPAKATQLIDRYSVDVVLDTVDYLESQMESRRPAGEGSEGSARPGAHSQRQGAASAEDTPHARTPLEPQRSAQRSSKRSTIENPAGLIVYSIENGLPVPASFLTRRKREELRHAARDERARLQARAEAETTYAAWLETCREQALAENFTPAELEARLAAMVRERSRADEAFRRVPAEHRHTLARRVLLRESGDALDLPSFDTWLTTHRQTDLF